MKTLSRAAAVLVLAVALGAAAALPGGAQATTVRVKIGDNYFKPTKLTVTAGDKVTWKWTGSAVHDVKVKKGPKKFQSPKKVDGSYSKVLTAPGKYQIYCTLHPNMTMKITVQPAAVTTSSPTTAPPAE